MRELPAGHSHAILHGEGWWQRTRHVLVCLPVLPAALLAGAKEQLADFAVPERSLRFDGMARGAYSQPAVSTRRAGSLRHPPSKMKDPLGKDCILHLLVLLDPLVPTHDPYITLGIETCVPNQSQS